MILKLIIRYTQGITQTVADYCARCSGWLPVCTWGGGGRGGRLGATEGGEGKGDSVPVCVSGAPVHVGESEGQSELCNAVLN